MTAAFVIGALFGIGATLLLRANEADDRRELMRQLRAVKRISLRKNRPEAPVRAALRAVRERIS
jgi:hypothetical protein